MCNKIDNTDNTAKLSNLNYIVLVPVLVYEGQNASTVLSRRYNTHGMCSHNNQMNQAHTFKLPLDPAKTLSYTRITNHSLN